MKNIFYEIPYAYNLSAIMNGKRKASKVQVLATENIRIQKVDYNKELELAAYVDFSKYPEDNSNLKANELRCFDDNFYILYDQYYDSNTNRYTNIKEEDLEKFWFKEPGEYSDCPFSTVRTSYGDYTNISEPEIPFRIKTIEESNKNIIIEKLHKASNDYIFSNGLVWKRIDEPYLLYNRNKIIISETQNSIDNNYFKFNPKDKDDLLEYLNKQSTGRNRKYYDDFQSGYIKVVNPDFFKKNFKDENIFEAFMQINKNMFSNIKENINTIEPKIFNFFYYIKEHKEKYESFKEKNLIQDWNNIARDFIEKIHNDEYWNNKVFNTGYSDQILEKYMTYDFLLEKESLNNINSYSF
jgi:hypothetical protein